ncbi:flagellar assembly protein FliH [Pseudothauera rhizosphaerae]|uniref:Flagellar assembly protein FliH n=1 Tax=Pseudothauera rhizosphaerae TaxID=2565932 RepID=A0A4S4AWZ4_9RHOO|nr:flagellar assembly protein FliH [Pseudothauera rhizosphaerae]THF64163.1 flagellar assembly protein FliH [Pseudothauera rhizosphaerae]
MSISRHQAVGAYRRWEPPSFDERAETPAVEAPAADPEPDTPPAEAESLLPPGIKLPTAEDIERLQEAARAEAHAEGHAEGRAAGHAEGRTEGYAAGLEEGRKAGYDEGRAQAQAEAERFAGLVGELDAAFATLDQGVAEELMGLALALTRKMVRETFASRPESVIDTLRAALQELPQNDTRIRLHPDDAALVRDYLGDQLAHGGHRLLEDDTVTRGGCLVEAGGTQIDATVETRWRRIVESLGRSETRWEDPA